MNNIPKTFKLFAATIKVIVDNERMNDKNLYGEANYNKQEITLSEVSGLETLSKDQIIDTFYHEKVHMILDSMGEDELSKNEKFVDVFAKLLRQSDETVEY